MADLYQVRHGQAGDVMGDYDRLSDRGWTQARRAGEGWRHLGVVHQVLHGAMRRHRETAEGFAEAFGGLPEPIEDARFDEFDHQAVVRAYVAEHGMPERPDRAAFFGFFAAAMARWSGGAHDADYPEGYAAFQARVEEGLSAAAAALPSGATALVFTSGGVVSAVVRQLLGLDPAAAFRVNLTLMNTGVTRLQVGAGRVSLVTLNEVSHLHGHPELLTRS